MEIYQLLQEMLQTLRRQELYLAGLHSTELFHLGIITEEEHAIIITDIADALRIDNARKEAALWPVNPKLVA